MDFVRGVGYGDCKNYLYCFCGLAAMCPFCLPEKSLGIKK